MAGEILGEIVVGALRLIGQMLIEGVLEILVKGPGYLICRVFNRKIDPDSGWTVLAGFVFWSVLGGAGYLAYRAS